MDISHWNMNQVMQLPDWCFGERWPVITSQRLEADTTTQWISEQSLPDAGVIWEVSLLGAYGVGGDLYYQIALGDYKPATGAEFQAFEKVFPGSYDSNQTAGQIFFGYQMARRVTMRKLMKPQGRRFAYLAHNAHATERMTLTLCVVVSSVPKEAPDWLVKREA